MHELIEAGIYAYAAKEVVGKTLGPTADYLGDNLKTFTEKRVANIGKILASTAKKLGDRIDTPGQVPPKILRTVLNEGSYAGSNLEVEYFGGILASSRTDEGRDDRGVRLAKITEMLSTYQIRAHYLIYATLAKEFHNKGYLFNHKDREKMAIFVPLDDFVQAMDFGGYETERLPSIIQHILWGLQAESLLEGNFIFNSHQELLKYYAGATDSGLVCQPSTLGAELFIHAMGQGDQAPRAIFDTNFPISIAGVPTGFTGGKAANPREHMLKYPTAID